MLMSCLSIYVLLINCPSLDEKLGRDSRLSGEAPFLSADGGNLKGKARG